VLLAPSYAIRRNPHRSIFRTHLAPSKVMPSIFAALALSLSSFLFAFLVLRRSFPLTHHAQGSHNEPKPTANRKSDRQIDTETKGQEGVLALRAAQRERTKREQKSETEYHKKEGATAMPFHLPPSPNMRSQHRQHRLR